MGVLDKFLNVMKLNDDYDDDDYLDDEIDDEFEEERPAKKHFFKKNDSFDEDDDFQDDFKIKEARKAKTVAPKASVSERPRQLKAQPVTSSKVSPIRPRKSSGMEVCVIKPKSMEDAREITETLLSGRTVILNLEGLDLEVAQRIIDFTSGATYAISGNLQKISNYIFLVTPTNVDISGDLQDLLNTSLDTSSMRTRF